MLQHPTGVPVLGRRLAALMLSLLVVSGHLADCAGWLSSPEARMACCEDEQTCPMHHNGSTPTASSHSVSQTDADRCCGASEQGAAVPSISHSAIDGVSALLPAVLPVPSAAFVAVPAGWHSPRPRSPSDRPRHVLLSVFLI